VDSCWKDGFSGRFTRTFILDQTRLSDCQPFRRQKRQVLFMNRTQHTRQGGLIESYSLTAGKMPLDPSIGDKMASVWRSESAPGCQYIFLRPIQIRLDIGMNILGHYLEEREIQHNRQLCLLDYLPQALTARDSEKVSDRPFVSRC
jgi:hypothetical protein